MQNNQALIVRRGTSDLIVLKYMRQRVRTTLNTLPASPTLHHIEALASQQRPLVYNFQERYGRIHRIALYNCAELLSCPSLAFVGFISRKQKPVEPTVIREIYEVDAQLVTEMVDNPGILAYSSLELRTGIWCNLVLMKNVEAKQQVLHTKTHAHAAYKLSPRYYAWIRLHTGSMPHGLFRDEIHTLHTRYYTFAVNAHKPLTYEHVYEQRMPVPVKDVRL